MSDGDLRETFAVVKALEPVLAKFDALLDGYPDKVDLIEASEVVALRRQLHARIEMIAAGLHRDDAGQGAG